jgi:hypothetical protein
MTEAGTTGDLARQIDERIRRGRDRGQVPQIVLDLDGTLFDNVPRTKQILFDQARALFGGDAPITRTIRDLAEEAFEYNPVDTLRKHGIDDEETLRRLREAWARQFFGSDYLEHDAPLDGAVDAARAWWDQGAELNYMTGRHVPEMYLGTCRSLHEAGFPIGTIRTQLLMKPVFDLNDVEFKIATVPLIRRKGPIDLVVDNDPRVLNPLVRAVPEAIAVMVRTLHPKDAPTLAGGIPTVEDFRELMT